MNAKEQQKLLERLIKEILSQLLVEDDNKKPEDGKSNQELKQEALKIINQLKNHINDLFDDDITISEDILDDHKNRKTILDYIQLCDSQGGVRLNNPALIRLEDAVKKCGGKTAQELGRKLVNNDETELELSLPISTVVHLLTLPFMGAALGSRLGAILESGGQAQRVGGMNSIFGAVFGGSLLSLVGIMAPSAIASTVINRDTEVPIVQTRAIARSLLNTITETRSGVAAALGAGISTTLLRAGIIPSTLRGGMTFSGLNIEWGSSLRSGLIVGTATGIGTALSTTLLRKCLNPNSSPSTAIQQASASQPMEEVIIQDTSL